MEAVTFPVYFNFGINGLFLPANTDLFDVANQQYNPEKMKNWVGMMMVRYTPNRPLKGYSPIEMPVDKALPLLEVLRSVAPDMSSDYKLVQSPLSEIGSYAWQLVGDDLGRLTKNDIWALFWLLFVDMTILEPKTFPECTLGFITAMIMSYDVFNSVAPSFLPLIACINWRLGIVYQRPVHAKEEYMKRAVRLKGPLRNLCGKLHRGNIMDAIRAASPDLVADYAMGEDTQFCAGGLDILSTSGQAELSEIFYLACHLRVLFAEAKLEEFIVSLVKILTPLYLAYAKSLYGKPITLGVVHMIMTNNQETFDSFYAIMTEHYSTVMEFCLKQMRHTAKYLKGQQEMNR
jgi:hypothetical protein